MYRKTYIITVFFLCIYTFPVIAQGNESVTTRQASNTGASSSSSGIDVNYNIMLARSNSDYRVTQGDVYTLSYAVGSGVVTYIITVDASYRIRVSNLGVINGMGKTFVQLKNEVEAIVANNYPLSGVQLVITQPALFRVHVNGEVNIAGEILTWGLNRLSSLANENLTSNASIRDISVKSANGQTRVYDLFKAQRLGDLSQDPYLRPGDFITFNRVNRVVTINGAVERPGIYQLLAGENLKNLMEIYANGFSPLADRTGITLTRYLNSLEISGDILYLTEEDFNRDFNLQHFDIISVPWRGLIPQIPYITNY
jgi:protein involved in polysaccharide export with SLBB domain